MPVALIDWDSAHPGTRLHDVAYLAWTWCVQSEGAVPVEHQCRRLAEVHRASRLLAPAAIGLMRHPDLIEVAEGEVVDPSR